MAIRYTFGEDDVPAGSLLKFTQSPPDDSDNWWAGVRNCAATIALAAVLANTAQATELAANIAQQKDVEEIPAGKLLKFQSPDEDYWNNPTPPLPPSLYQRLPLLPDPDEIPAGVLFGQPDEDFDWNLFFGPRPLPASLWQRLPLADLSDDPAGSLFGQAEEDFWQNPVPSVPARHFLELPYNPDPEEISANTLKNFPGADEDFWRNPTPPIPAALLWPQQFLFDPVDNIPLVISGQPDEDFDWNLFFGPRPLPALGMAAASGLEKVQRLPLADLGDDPAGALFGCAEEDYWQNPTAAVPARHFLELPYNPDPEEIPANTLANFPGADEDFWRNPTAPIPAVLLWPQQFAFDPADNIPSVAPGEPDEDYWTNPTRPVAAALLWPQQFPFDTQDPAGKLFGQDDEDFWQNPVPPVPARQLLLQPFAAVSGALGDPSDEGALRGPEEDYWQNPVAPIAAALVPPKQFAFEQNESATGLHGQPDEDFDWHLRFGPPPQPLRIYQPLPYLWDKDLWSKQISGEMLAQWIGFAPALDAQDISIAPAIALTDIDAAEALLSEDVSIAPAMDANISIAPKLDLEDITGAG